MNTPTPTDTFGAVLFWIGLAAVLGIVAASCGIALSYSREPLLKKWFGQFKPLHIAVAAFTISAFAVLAFGLLRGIEDTAVRITGTAVGAAAGLVYTSRHLLRVVPIGQIEVRRGHNAKEQPDASEFYFAEAGNTFFLEAAETVLATIPQFARISKRDQVEVEAADGTFVAIFRVDATVPKDEGAYRAFFAATDSKDLSDLAARETYILGRTTDRFRAFMTRAAVSYSIPAHVAAKKGTSAALEPPFPDPDVINGKVPGLPQSLEDELNRLEGDLELEFGLVLTISVVEYELTPGDKASLSEGFETDRALRAAERALAAQGFSKPDPAVFEAAYRLEHGIAADAQLTLSQREELARRIAPHRDAYSKALADWVARNSDAAEFRFFDFRGLENMTHMSLHADPTMFGGGAPQGKGQGAPQVQGQKQSRRRRGGQK
jgi:hypothetical protein